MEAAVEVDQGVEFLDRRHPPIVVPADTAGQRARHGGLPGELRAARLDPREPGVQVTDRAVAVVAIAGRRAGIEGVLTEKRLARLGRRQKLSAVAEDVSSGRCRRYNTCKAALGIRPCRARAAGIAARAKLQAIAVTRCLRFIFGALDDWETPPLYNQEI